MSTRSDLNNPPEDSGTNRSPLKTIGLVILVILIAVGVIALGLHKWQEHADTDTDPTDLSDEADTTTYDFACDVYLRVYGETDWHYNSIDAAPGDVIEVWAEYTNLNAETQYNVGIWATLPDGIRYINETSKLYNALNKDGVIVADDIVGAGLNLGDYSGHNDVDFTYTNSSGEEQPGGANAILCFALEIAEEGDYNGATIGLRAGTENEPAMTQIVPLKISVPTSVEAEEPTIPDAGESTEA